jgi:Ribosome-associated heat shock protein implicated in the recycling of the 50S subunit (S4 paralog)
MRIDKFLWCIRLFKTRSLATEQVRLERVRIADQTVKPSREVKAGEVIEVKKEGVWLRYRILALPKARMGAALVPDYAKDITPDEERQKQEFIQMMRHLNRPRGSGRPTKKERRDLDDFRLDE